MSKLTLQDWVVMAAVGLAIAGSCLPLGSSAARALIGAAVFLFVLSILIGRRS